MSDAPETLHETMQRQAASLSEIELTSIIAAFREQRARWNVEQSAGSRKRVPSTKIMVDKSAKPARPPKPTSMLDITL